MKKHFQNLFLSLCAVLVLTGCGRSEEEALDKCRANLRKVAEAISVYEAEWNMYPMNWEGLEEEFKEDSRISLTSESFVCPASKDGSCSYELLCPGAEQTPGTPVVCCRGHKDKILVGRGDGSVCTAPELIKEDGKWKMKWPEK